MGCLGVMNLAPQPPAPAKARGAARHRQRWLNVGGMTSSDRVQALAGAGIPEHNPKNRAAIKRIDQQVGAIGIADLIHEGTSGVWIGAARLGEVGAEFAAEILQEEGAPSDSRLV